MEDQKRTLLQGKMNKDVDERLLPDGQYTHAENLQTSQDAGGNMGVGKSVSGNVKLTTLTGLTNARTIGAFTDGSNSKVYYFVTSTEKDLVMEFDYTNKQLNVLLESSRPNGVLNFDKNHLITGINKFVNGDFKKDLLAWTDDFNPPRIINIERAKTYGLDGFTEEDISVIKRPPIDAPTYQLTYTDSTLENNLEELYISAFYRFKYLDGEYSALSPGCDVAFAPKAFSLDFQTMENEGMVNAFNAVRFGFNTGSKRVTDIQLVYKISNSNTLNVIETFNKKELGWGDDEAQDFLFFNSKKYTTLPETELKRTFDNVPLLSKGQEVIGNRLGYANYLEGYDIVDLNGEEIGMDYSLSLHTEDISGLPFPISVSTTTNANDTISLDLTGLELKKDTKLTFDLLLNEKFYNNGGKHTVDDVFILNRDFINASDLASDEEFLKFINVIMTNSFLSGFELTEPDNSVRIANTNFEVIASNATTIIIKAPTLTYQIDNTPADVNDSDFTNEISWWEFDEIESTVLFNLNAVNSSLKTNRSYEVGIIYKDAEARATTALTSLKNTLYIPQEYSTSKNKIRVLLNHKPPAWAKYYNFVVKQNKLNYETIYANLFYIDELYRWVKLEGANVNKVKEGDTLIVKSDLNGVLEEVIKVRVLEVAVKEKNFIEGNENIDGDEIFEEAGLYMKIKPSGFDMSFDDSASRTYEGGSHLRYPVRTHTNPIFGEMVADVFQPYVLNAGSTVRIYIKVKARGNISYEEKFDKSFRVNGNYASVKEWFEAEVEDLGSFGRDYTWNGVDYMHNGSDYGYGIGDANNKVSGWGFNADGSKFYVMAHRDGTASRSITTTVKFEILATEGMLIFETEPTEIDTEIFYETSQTFRIENNNHKGNIQDQDVTSSLPAIAELNAFNCYVQGNGAESFKIKDVMLKNFLNFDLRPTATSIEKYKAQRRLTDITYSAPYVESSNVNGLNEFNLSTANFKDDIDKKYGSIQKLYSRDTNLVVFQEDKVGHVLFGKDVLYNADGTSNLSSIENVLGQYIAYAGEYGISKNPESFSVHGNYIYFTDAKRGYVLRLGMDGITEISQYGMRTWFKDLFRSSINKKKVGAFDPYNDVYTLASEDLSIYNPNIVLDCSKSYKGLELSDETTFTFDFGLAIGDVGFDYNVLNGTANIEITWNGNTYATGNVTGSGQLTFTKNLPIPKTAIVKITPYQGNADVLIDGICHIGALTTVIPIIMGDSADTGKTALNRFKWSLGGYNGNFKNIETVFAENELTHYEKLDGEEGTTFFPPVGATVLIEAFKRFDDNAVFGADDRLGYLVSNTLISEANYLDAYNSATWLVPTETVMETGDILNSSSFVLAKPSNERYLYLFWDYSNFSSVPVAVNDLFNVNQSGSVNFELRGNDYDADGDALTVEIVTSPSNGNVVIEPDGTITYTHTGVDSTNDSFTYKVTDGSQYSNVATVSVNVKNTGGGSLGSLFNMSSLGYGIGGSDGEGACAYSLNATKYHDGLNNNPVLADVVYNDEAMTTPFNGQNKYYAISNGRTIKISTNGIVLDEWICGAGNA